MSQDGGYDFHSPTPPSDANSTPPGDLAPFDISEPAPAPARLKPGDPGWVPPVPIIEKADSVEEEPTGDPDVEKHKGLALLGYVCFLIPLVAAPNSKFARFHANQGLLAFITLVVITVVVVALYIAAWASNSLMVRFPLLQWFFGCGITLLQFACLVGWVALVIVGIIHAANGEKKELPIIGHWKLIK